MSENARDTHFQEFAKLLWQDMMSVQGGEIGWIDISSDGLDDEWIEKFQRLISQRAYDLACHTLRSTAYGLDLFDIPFQVNENVPDMTEWPKTDGR